MPSYDLHAEHVPLNHRKQHASGKGGVVSVSCTLTPDLPTLNHVLRELFANEGEVLNPTSEEVWSEVWVTEVTHEGGVWYFMVHGKHPDVRQRRWWRRFTRAELRHAPFDILQRLRLNILKAAHGAGLTIETPSGEPHFRLDVIVI